MNADDCTYDEAVDEFHRADALEKQAKAIREKARKVILAYWQVNMDEFMPTGDDGKTFVRDRISITVPVKEAHFDETRAVECQRELADLVGEEVAETLFIRMPVFAGPEQVIRTARAWPEFAASIAGVLMKYTIPTEPMSPRVTPVKGKK